MDGGSGCHNGNGGVCCASNALTWSGRVVEREQIADGEHLGGEKAIEPIETEGSATAQEIGDVRGLKSCLACEESSIHTASIDPPKDFLAEALLQLGKVHCGNAALALLSISTWSDGAWRGMYACWNPQQTADVWPGDVLKVKAPSADISTGLLVREVQVRATSCAPELLRYTVRFANEWAEALSLKMSEGAPANAWLPPRALTAPNALASLRDLAVGSVSTTQIQVQAGLTPPSGGGFEVRRSDWKFGAGDGADLVLRSPVAAFTIVRQAPVECYYVRMYDGASPPNYSRFSSAIFVNATMQ